MSTDPIVFARSAKGASDWRSSGLFPLWLMAGMAALCMLVGIGLMVLLVRGSIPYFWPDDVMLFSYVEELGDEPELRAGRLRGSQLMTADTLRSQGEEILDGEEPVNLLYIKIGNREINGLDFIRILSSQLVSEPIIPPEMIVFERRQWGDFYGTLTHLLQGEQILAEGEGSWQQFQQVLSDVQIRYRQTRALEEGRISAINRELEALWLAERRLLLDDLDTEEAMAEIASERQQLQEEYIQEERALTEARVAVRQWTAQVEDVAGDEYSINLADIVRAYRPNELGFWGKMGIFLQRLLEFFLDEPREANTEGGVFPAIFGTVAMVLMMTVLVTPFGVLAAFYLYEYRQQSAVVRTIRICINNLAGVPSIVFGVFGLGFFIYGLGGNLDELFFPERLPNPTFGTPGLFWAALTLALLTLPVVVVSTEEGLTRVPTNLRYGALALGATRYEMLTRIVLPLAMPGIFTGVILAVARAAGEVAPLMLVGAVKFSPHLPISGDFPYIHLNQKFMHLGLHIYDAGFQSPNAEAALPLVYATSLLLITVILVLNLGAIWVRHNFRERARLLEI